MSTNRPASSPGNHTPAVVRRSEKSVSPWVRLVEKEVRFNETGTSEIYHCLAQADYVVILAQLPDGRIPIVRQFRPAVEDFTWEFPAGLVDGAEDPEQTCRRELLEETGLEAESVLSLGSYYPDTGRLENRIHAFFVVTSRTSGRFVPEPGIQVELVALGDLRERIRTGTFRHQLHLAVLATAPIFGVSLAER